MYEIESIGLCYLGETPTKQIMMSKEKAMCWLCHLVLFQEVEVRIAISLSEKGSPPTQEYSTSDAGTVRAVHYINVAHTMSISTEFGFSRFAAVVLT